MGSTNAGSCPGSTFTCCALTAPFRAARELSEHVFLVPEGFDPDANIYLPDVDYEYDVSFIGKLRSPRDKFQKVLGFTNITGAYGRDHSEAVCKTRINLNFTRGGTSDRTFKVLASKGFLLTQPWELMEEWFTPGKDLVLFETKKDLRKKIDYYLNNFDEAQAIADHGYQTVKKFSRDNWAKRIVELTNQVRGLKSG